MPRIGITGARLDVDYVPGFPLEVMQARTEYINGFFPADDIAVSIIPGLEDTARKADIYLNGIDALLVTGGSDVGPINYGAERLPTTGAGDPGRDAAELALIAAAEQRGMPVLGICRGLQILNTHREGTLHQHLPDVVGTDVHQVSSTGFSQHPVEVSPDSALYQLGGEPRFDVMTYHHQGIDRLGTGLKPVAWADDGIIEAVETEAVSGRGRSGQGWKALGVQWHPEAGEGAVHRVPFDWLSERARDYALRTTGARGGARLAPAVRNARRHAPSARVAALNRAALRRNARAHESRRSA